MAMGYTTIQVTEAAALVKDILESRLSTGTLA